MSSFYKTETKNAALAVLISLSPLSLSLQVLASVRKATMFLLKKNALVTKVTCGKKACSVFCLVGSRLAVLVTGCDDELF
jgi:hypothetical protein